MTYVVSSLRPANRAEWIGVAVYAVALILGMVLLAGVSPDFWFYPDLKTFEGRDWFTRVSLLVAVFLAVGGLIFGFALFEGDHKGNPLPVAILLAVIGGVFGYGLIGALAFKFAEFWVYAEMPRVSMLAFWAAVPAFAMSAPAMWFFGPKGTKVLTARRRRLTTLDKVKTYPAVAGTQKAAAVLTLLLATVLVCRGVLYPFGEYFLNSAQTLF